MFQLASYVIQILHNHWGGGGGVAKCLHLITGGRGGQDGAIMWLRNIWILPYLEAEIYYIPFLLFIEWFLNIMHKKQEYRKLLVLPISTPGVSLGVLSPQGTHSTTYTEHMNKLHTAMQPACPGKFSYRPPWQGPDAAPTFRLIAYFVSWYWHSRDSNPKSSTDRPAPIRITPWQLAISGPNLCPVTEHRGWVVWPPHLLPRHSIITLHRTNGGICIMCVHSNQRRSMVTHYKVESRHSTSHP